MTEPIDPARLATIRNNHAYDQGKGFLLQADNRDLGDLLKEVDRLNARVADLDKAAERKNRLLVRLEEQRDEQRARADRLAKELADLRPYAEAGKALAAKQAESEYYHGTCDDCSCCTTAQCREGRCPENSIGESTCPCTCD